MQEPTLNDQSLFHIAPEFRLSYAPDLSGVVMVWRGYHTSTAFRALNEQVLAALIAHQATRILCDIRHFLLIGAEDQRWLNADWLPRAIEAGLRHCAIVTPLYFFNRVAVGAVVDRLDTSRVQVEYFEDAERARAWLRAGTVPPIPQPAL
jgi:hypothetical protein